MTEKPLVLGMTRISLNYSKIMQALLDAVCRLLVSTKFTRLSHNIRKFPMSISFKIAYNLLQLVYMYFNGKSETRSASIINDINIARICSLQ